LYYITILDSIEDERVFNDEDDIRAYLLRVNEVIKNIRVLGETIEDAIIVNKVLISLPSIFDSKVFSIEEAKNLDMFSMYEMHGLLTSYEMRIDKPKSSNRESIFKSIKNVKVKYNYDDEGEILDS